MTKSSGCDMVHRYESNPVIDLTHLSFKAMDICNAGVARCNGAYVLLVSIQTLRGLYYMYAARSDDGLHFEMDNDPLLGPSDGGPYARYDEFGVLDARVTPLDGIWYISFDVLSRHGFRLGLGKTDDFRHIERIGLVSEPDTKAGALFPRKINGKYARLERPWERGSIWLSYSNDLTHWGWSDIVLTPRSGHWDHDRVGVAMPPVEIHSGWLLVYYGVKQTSAGPLFRLGAAILDRDNPVRIAGRTNVPILAPREPYERIGDVPNLVFSCGGLVETGDVLRLYYGAANSCICMGTIQIEEIVETCLQSEREF
jgi:predicted GH43/DUF377 family glycosyl hydrolase